MFWFMNGICATALGDTTPKVMSGILQRHFPALLIFPLPELQRLRIVLDVSVGWIAIQRAARAIRDVAQLWQ